MNGILCDEIQKGREPSYGIPGYKRRKIDGPLSTYKNDAHDPNGSQSSGYLHTLRLAFLTLIYA